MIYLDTSALAKLIVRETETATLGRWLHQRATQLWVTSIIGRFLEHSRIFYFGNSGDPQVYIGSADWMDRNLSRRVEVVFPIEVPDLKKRLIDEILAISLADNVKARELMSDGSYRRVQAALEQPRVRSQERFLELAAQHSARALDVVPQAEADPRTVSTRRPRKRQTN